MSINKSCKDCKYCLRYEHYETCKHPCAHGDNATYIHENWTKCKYKDLQLGYAPIDITIVSHEIIKKFGIKIASKYNETTKTIYYQASTAIENEKYITIKEYMPTYTRFVEDIDEIYPPALLTLVSAKIFRKDNLNVPVQSKTRAATFTEFITYDKKTKNTHFTFALLNNRCTLMRYMKFENDKLLETARFDVLRNGKRILKQIKKEI